MKVGPKKFDTPPEIFGMCAPDLISNQRSYIHQKLDTNGCFAKLRYILHIMSLAAFIRTLNMQCISQFKNGDKARFQAPIIFLFII
jgi:hypothetical protein